MLKSNASYTSESSSGVFSNDGNVQSSEQSLKTENLAELERAKLVSTQPSVEQSSPALNDSVDGPTTLLSQVSLHSVDTAKSQDLTNSSDTNNEATSLSKDNTVSSRDKMTKNNIGSESIGNVTRHLMSVRQRSLLGR